MFYGVAIGDAVALPFEFHGTTPHIPKSDLINTVPFSVKFREYSIKVNTLISDDTEMTLALLNSIITNQNYDRSSAILAYEEFANNSTLAGKNTRAMFKGIKTVKGYQNRFNKLEIKDKEEKQSNGCLMRASPLILVDPKDIETDVYLSNPNKIALNCVNLFVLILKEIMKGKTREDIGTFCFQQLDNLSEEVKQAVLDSKFTEYKRDISTKKGWVCNSLYIALYAFWHFNSFEEAMRFIVNIPRSDTDTNCSIAGALFGAYLGVHKMKQEKYTSQNIEILKKELTRFDQILKRK